MIYEADERFTDEGLISEMLLLPENYTAGTHWLSIRLDPYTDVQSQVAFSDVRLGQLDVSLIPEPTTALLLGVGGLLLLVRRRGEGRASRVV